MLSQNNNTYKCEKNNVHWVRRLWVFLVLLHLPFLGFSQILAPEYSGCGGDYLQQGGYTLSFTLGEFASETYSNNEHLTQGFQQPHFLIMSIDEESLESGLRLFPYPNPTTNEIRIQMSAEAEKHAWLVKLYDTHGRLLYDEPFQVGSSINLANHSAGTYFLHLFSEKIERTFKVLKCD